MGSAKLLSFEIQIFKKVLDSSLVKTE